MYYLRTKPAASAIQFTVDKTKLNISQSTGDSPAEMKMIDNEKNREAMVCSLQNKEDCMMCGS